MEFKSFNKIARLSREVVITEKIDGTNGLIAIGENGEFQVGSRNQWLTDDNGNILRDNAGFAKWAVSNRQELMELGVGYHYGEWWGEGIQRGYGMKGKRFSLFNVNRWNVENIPSCCLVVPTLYHGMFSTVVCDEVLDVLREIGSQAAPGFMRPEGIVIFHTAQGHLYKKTLEKDEAPKGTL